MIPRTLAPSLAALARVLALLAAVIPAKASMNMIFTNTGVNYSPTNTWITIQRGQPPTSSVTNSANIPALAYGGNQFVWNMYTNYTTNYINPTNYTVVTNVGNIYSESVLLSDINSAGGITWTSNAPSAVVWVSYGTPLPVSNYTLSGISPSASADPSYNIPYTAIELTYYGGNSNDQGDITAINYFTAPVRISAYSGSSANGSQIGRSAGFNPSAATSSAMLTEFNQVTGSNSTAVLTNNAGQVTRVIGPTQFGVGQANASDFGPYTNLSAYFGSLSNVTTVFSNVSGYNTVITPGTNVAYTNANVVFVLTNAVTSTTNGYAFTANGTITVVTLGYAVGGSNISSATNTYDNVTFTVTPGANEENLAAAFTYYGGYSASTNIVIGGAGWTSFSNFVTSGGFVDGGNNPAASIISAQIAGEISTGYDAGLPGSTNINPQFPGTPIGQLPSGDWWNMTNITLFSAIQTNTGYYNQYADIIYRYSSNTVYGMTYSDRFNYGSPYVSAAPGVGSWLVELGDPLASVPEPTLAATAIVFFIGFAAYKSRSRRKAA